MEKIGYCPKPPHKRRGPRTKGHGPGRTGNVAVISMGMSKELISGGIFSPLTYSVENALRKENIATLFIEAEDITELPSIVSPSRIDGLIIAGVYPSKAVLKELRRFPIVWVLGDFPKGSVIADHVTPNDESVGWLAADYLTKRKHKHIACINPQIGHPAFTLRCNSFMNAAQSFNIKATELDSETNTLAPVIARPGGNEEETIRLIDAIINMEDRPTGLFIPSDYHAALAHREIRRKGIWLGKEIDIIGCNNEKQVLHGLEPRPATIDIQVHEIASRAVELLLTRMREDIGRPYVHIRIEPVVVSGDACDRYEWEGSHETVE